MLNIKLNIIIIFRRGDAIGEIVYLTSLVNCLYLENSKYKIIIFTKYPEIFFYNRKIFLNLKIYNNLIYRLIFFIFFRITGSNIVDFNPEKKKLDHDTNFLKDYPNNTHLALVVRKFELNLQSNFIKNEIFFSNQEKEFFEKKFLLPDEYAVIHSQAKLTYAKNKFIERFSNDNDIISKMGYYARPMLTDKNLVKNIYDPEEKNVDIILKGYLDNLWENQNKPNMDNLIQVLMNVN
jgi:hypothetical protein